MSKGQQRSNKEAKKPKSAKPKAVAAEASPFAATQMKNKAAQGAKKK